MGVCSRLEFVNIVHIYCLGYDYYSYDAFDIYVAQLSIYDVKYHITTKPEGACYNHRHIMQLMMECFMNKQHH